MTDKLYYLIKSFQGIPKVKVSQVSIKGILENKDKLSKSNQLRYMTNGSKNKKIYILPHFDPVVWVLSSWLQDTPLQQFLLNSLLFC